MVSVEFFRDNMGFQAMELNGHADYNPGKDIVCAGISALAFALVGTLRNVQGISFRKCTVDNGVQVEIEPFIEPEDRAITDTVFKTILVGLKQIEKKYPDHISIKEVDL